VSFKFVDELHNLYNSVPGAAGDMGEVMILLLKRRLKEVGTPEQNSYRSSRWVKHRRRMGRQVRHVDLELTGRMLDDLVVLSGEGVAIAPSGRGSRFRDSSGRWAKTGKASIHLGFKSARSEFIADMHNRRRQWMNLEPLAIQESMEIFGNALYRMKSGKDILKFKF